MNRDEKTNPSGAQMQTQNSTGTKRLPEPEVTQKQTMPKMPESLTRHKMLQKTENLRSSQTQKTLTEPEMLTTEEKWERAGLTDTFIFYKVMTENPDTCRRLLELLLHVKIEKIEILGEKSLGIDTESKGIRLDVYVKDENRTFDVEMQVKDTGELPERSISSLKKLQFFEATLKKRVANRAIFTVATRVLKRTGETSSFEYKVLSRSHGCGHAQIRRALQSIKGKPRDIHLPGRHL